MLYTPVPGTPLYQEMAEQGRMLNDIDFADIHGQYKFNFRHAAISRDDSKRFLDWAFWRDFERNGPSLYRMCQTMLQGWRRYKDYPDPRVRERFTREVKKLGSAYNAALWVMEREFRKVNRSVSEQIHKLRREVEKEFPVVARLPRHRWARSCCGRRAGRKSGWRRTNLRTADISGAPQLDTGFVAFRPADGGGCESVAAHPHVSIKGSG